MTNLLRVMVVEDVDVEGDAMARDRGGIWREMVVDCGGVIAEDFLGFCCGSYIVACLK